MPNELPKRRCPFCAETVACVDRVTGTSRISEPFAVYCRCGVRGPLGTTRADAATRWDERWTRVKTTTDDPEA
jgi:hypothetical protein